MRSRIKIILIFGLTISFQNCSTAPAHKVGDSYGGGVIFYVDGSGDHGLIVATSDLDSAAIWGCEGTNLAGAAGTTVGAGNQNTTDILNGCPTSNIAARFCEQLSLNGHDDWFLPSTDELFLLYQQQNELGGFSTSLYWSSTEMDNTYARGRHFADGTLYGLPKNTIAQIRPIRAF